MTALTYLSEDELSAQDELARQGGARARSGARPARGKTGKRQKRPKPGFPGRARVVGGVEVVHPVRCVCPAHGTEYVRWVQSALNQLQSLRLPVNGVMDAPTRAALRSFQQSRGLPPDGIAGPDTEQAMRDARRSAGPAAPATEPQPEPAQDEVYAFETLDFESPSNMPTLRQGSRGSTVIDLQRRLNATGFDAGPVDGIFGSLTDTAVRSFQRARGLGVDGIAGPNTWAALLGAPPSGGVPTSPPTSTPGTLPAAWSDGPVNAPLWRPTLSEYSSINCGSSKIPTGLPPESVTRGWTPRTRAVADVIRGSLFGWKNVAGEADGSQAGHISGSYHYCGRAIDAFPPGVAWQSRAAGEGLRAGWRLANWAAHNAAAQKISEVIFYDHIWTVARSTEGWRPYQHSAGSSGDNSLQHRDHVHISVY